MITEVIIKEKLDDGTVIERKCEDVLSVALWYREDVISLADDNEIEIDENDEQFWKQISDWIIDDFPPTEEDLLEVIRSIVGE